MVDKLKLRICVLTLTVMAVCAGCAQKDFKKTSSATEPNTISIDGVPFVKQQDDFCGPAAMASLMQFYGQDISQEEIADKVYTPKLEGALISDMENFAREQGYVVEVSEGSIDQLTSLIDGGTPVITLVDRGVWKVSIPHYYVLYGYNSEKDTFLLHSGDKCCEEMEFGKLDGEWERMNRLMLVITK